MNAMGVMVAAFALAASSADPATELRGEVVDLHCYLTRSARGAEHAGCANACISRGVTPGFVADDGKVYLLLAERPVSPKEMLAELAGKPVTVTGTVVERDGVRAVTAGSVRPRESGPGDPR
jgi:hypothetical protein